MFGYEDEASSVPEVKEEKLLLKKKQLELFQHLFSRTIISPIVGQAVALSDVNDPVFSSGAMGANCHQTNWRRCYAPADAEVTIAFLQLVTLTVWRPLMVLKSWSTLGLIPYQWAVNDLIKSSSKVIKWKLVMSLVHLMQRKLPQLVLKTQLWWSSLTQLTMLLSHLLQLDLLWRVIRSSKSKLNRNNKFSRTGLSSQSLNFFLKKSVFFFEKRKDWLQNML